MIGLLLATEMEAKGLLEQLAACKVGDGPFEMYSFAPSGDRPGGLIVLSGMGPDRASRATEYLLSQPGVARIINVGVCGALDGAGAGTLWRVGEAVDGDALLAGSDSADCTLHGGPWNDLPPARLATVAKPVFEDHRRETLASRADLVDMEGFAVVKTCNTRNVPCYLLKGVTDLADADGRQSIQRNIDAVSQSLAHKVIQGLAVLGMPQLSGRPVEQRVNAENPQSEIRNPQSSGAWSRLMRFVRIEHTLFSLPLLLAGAFLGAGERMPHLYVLVLILLAGVGARCLGMAMNRILDRDLDALNPRTAGRELPSGRLSFAAAYAVAAGGLAVYLLACAMLGWLVLLLSPLPALLLVGYSLLKRFTCLCHFGIGLCLAAAPLAAFIAASGSVNFTVEALALAAFAFCWMSGYDIIYALLDIESDRKTGVRSIPARLGAAGALCVSAGLHAVAAAALAVIWWRMGGHAAAGASAAVAVLAFGASYVPMVPVAFRFFPISAVAGIAGAMVPLLGGMQ